MSFIISLGFNESVFWREEARLRFPMHDLSVPLIEFDLIFPIDQLLKFRLDVNINEYFKQSFLV